MFLGAKAGAAGAVSGLCFWWRLCRWKWQGVGGFGCPVREGTEDLFVKSYQLDIELLSETDKLAVGSQKWARMLVSTTIMDGRDFWHPEFLRQ